MAREIDIFLSYSHQDSRYLHDDSLLGYLRGLRKSGFALWTDREITPGEHWDDVIKARIQRADIALVLVSQAFLDSDYCQNVEIQGFLSAKAHLFPVILSPCDWQRHEWLAQRQHLPGDDQTLEEHFADIGARKRLFLKIREHLSERADSLRSIYSTQTIPTSPPDNSVPDNSASSKTSFTGAQKLEFCQRLGDDWQDLATLLEIPSHRVATFERGYQPHGIWQYLEERDQLGNLIPALNKLARERLCLVLTSPGT